MTVYNVRWKRQWGGNDRIVWVNIPKLDKYWRLDSGYYFECGQGRPVAYRHILDAVITGRILPMPHITFDADDPERIGFTDGRHRFAWVRDHGGIAIPVTFVRQEVDHAMRRFGTKRSTCQVKITSHAVR